MGFEEIPKKSEEGNGDEHDDNDDDDDPVKVWMSLGFVIGGVFGTVVVHLILEFSRRKPTWKVTVIDSLWVYCCYILLVRNLSIHSIWIARSWIGPLGLSFAYARVMIERITLISGASCATLSSILRLAYVLAWKTMHDFSDGQILLGFQVVWLGLSGMLFLVEMGLYFFWYGHYFVGIESEVALLSRYSWIGPPEGNPIRLVLTLGFLGACALISLICRGSIYFKESFQWKKISPPSSVFAHASLNKNGYPDGNVYLIDDHGVLETIRVMSKSPPSTKTKAKPNKALENRFPILRLISNHRISPMAAATFPTPVPKSGWQLRLWRPGRKLLCGKFVQPRTRLSRNVLTFSSQLLLTLCLFLTSLMQFVSVEGLQSDVFGIFVVGPVNCSIIIPCAMMAHNPELHKFVLRRFCRFGRWIRTCVGRQTATYLPFRAHSSFANKCMPY